MRRFLTSPAFPDTSGGLVDLMRLCPRLAFKVVRPAGVASFATSWFARALLTSVASALLPVSCAVVPSCVDPPWLPLLVLVLRLVTLALQIAGSVVSWQALFLPGFFEVGLPVRVTPTAPVNGPS